MAIRAGQNPKQQKEKNLGKKTKKQKTLIGQQKKQQQKQKTLNSRSL